jgi:hypothetical protein
MIRQEFGEESMSRALVFEYNAWFRAEWRRKKAREVRSKVKSMLIIFFGINGIVHKEFVMVGQTVPHTTVTFYDDCMKMCDDFSPNFGDKITGC